MSAGVKARWHAPVFEVDQSDPFGDDDEQAVPLDLDGKQALLNRRLVELLEEESHLFDIGVTCDVRGLPGVSCAVCPISQGNGLGPAAALCRVGAEQERVVTAIAVGRVGIERE